MHYDKELQKAGRAFLPRLVAEYGPVEVARILRSSADELEALWRSSAPVGQVGATAPD